MDTQHKLGIIKNTSLNIKNSYIERGVMSLKVLDVNSLY